MREHYAANRALKLAKSKAYALANHEQIRVRRKAHYEANRERIIERQRTPQRKVYSRAYYAANRERLNAKKRAWEAAHQDHVKARRAAHYQANVAEIRLKAKAYRDSHRSVIAARRPKYAEERERLLAYQRQRRASDPGYRLRWYLRNRVRGALQKGSKSAPTLALLGCTIPEWRVHLEALFRPGMTWENYGPVWHVDHRKPCASFDLTDPAQQRACFHYTNTQPLFAAENLKKSDLCE